MPDRILITTDDLEHAVRINAGVEAAGFHTTLAHTLDEARQALRRDPPPDCVVVTGGLHESGAGQLLTLARDRSVSTLGLVEDTEPDAKGLARRLGLTGYLEKPADPAEVAATVRRLIERRKLQQRTGIIGESPAIQEVLVKIEQMAPVTSTVLIEGESGTGKELVARAIHDLSPRRAKPFIAVNCAARHAGEAVASARGPELLPRRRDAGDPGRRAGDRRHQQVAQGRGGAGPVP